MLSWAVVVVGAGLVSVVIVDGKRCDPFHFITAQAPRWIIQGQWCAGKTEGGATAGARRGDSDLKVDVVPTHEALPATLCPNHVRTLGHVAQRMGIFAER